MVVRALAKVGRSAVWIWGIEPVGMGAVGDEAAGGDREGGDELEGVAGSSGMSGVGMRFLS